MGWFLSRFENDDLSFRFAWPPHHADDAIDDLTADILSVAALILPAVQQVSESARNAARDIDIDFDFTIDIEPSGWALPEDAFSFAFA